MKARELQRNSPNLELSFESQYQFRRMLCCASVLDAKQRVVIGVIRHAQYLRATTFCNFIGKSQRQQVLATQRSGPPAQLPSLREIGHARVAGEERIQRESRQTLAVGAPRDLDATPTRM
eukprot:9804739-Alexandrium_andersonii.AAC.1